MDAYLSTLIGVLVSIFLFVLGYKQTIGAKKERAKSANLSVHNSLMRRMVLENYSPVYKDISRVLEGNARISKVSTNDLHSEEQIINSLFTEVFDNDLISPTQRIEIEEKLRNLIEKIEKSPQEPNFSDLKTLSIERSERNHFVFKMVIFTSVIGGVASLMLNILESEPTSLLNAIGEINSEMAFTGIAAVITSIIILQSVLSIQLKKERIYGVSMRSTQLNNVSFEREVSASLVKANVAFIPEAKIQNHQIDFLIQEKAEKIAIEVKAWDESVPNSIMARTLNHLNRLAELKEIDKVILIIKKLPSFHNSFLKDDNVKILTLSEFNKYLKSLTKQEAT